MNMCNPLEEFKNANWGEILPRLTAHALRKVRRLHWNTPQGTLPQGKTVEDLVSEAIDKTLQGLLTEDTGKGLRKWDPQKVPDLLYFLKRVVDSDVNALVELDEHQEFNYSAKRSPESASKHLEADIDIGGHKDEMVLPETPEEKFELRQRAENSNERYKRLLAALYKESEGDDDEVMVLIAMEELLDADEELTPAAIAAKTGLNRDQVKNIRKRIERNADKVRETFLSREEETADEKR